MEDGMLADGWKFEGRIWAKCMHSYIGIGVPGDMGWIGLRVVIWGRLRAPFLIRTLLHDWFFISSKIYLLLFYISLDTVNLGLRHNV